MYRAGVLYSFKESHNETIKVAIPLPCGLSTGGIESGLPAS